MPSSARSAALVAIATGLIALGGCGGGRPVTGDSGTPGSGGKGSPGTGGATSSGTGGAMATGGATATGGGTSATGGRAGGTGGSTSTGGAPSGTGGATSGTGGATSGTGGATVTDGGAGCTYDGKTYAVGASFPATDGCNTCTCGSGGGVGCTKIACPADGGTTTCALDMSMHFWDDGGFRAYTDDSKLTAPRTHTVARDRLMNAPPATCMREIPCTAASPTDIDITKIRAALAHADVTAALAMTTKPFYGTDTRPVDGSVFMFERADGRGFTLGSGTAVPAGLRTLEDVLHQLQTQTIASTNCANLR